MGVCGGGGDGVFVVVMGVFVVVFVMVFDFLAIFCP